MSPRTVFSYFATKEEAILGFDPSRSLEVGRSVLERPARESPLTSERMVILSGLMLGMVLAALDQKVV